MEIQSIRTAMLVYDGKDQECSSTLDERSIEDMLQKERSNSFKHLQAMLQSMQETMVKNYEVMVKNHEEMKKEIGVVRNDTEELKEKLQKMDEKFENFQEQISKNKQRLHMIQVSDIVSDILPAEFLQQQGIGPHPIASESSLLYRWSLQDPTSPLWRKPDLEDLDVKSTPTTLASGDFVTIKDGRLCCERTRMPWLNHGTEGLGGGEKGRPTWWW
ncbi:hypothetical protein L345_08031, partial [Ophiophagus hannah]